MFDMAGSASPGGFAVFRIASDQGADLQRQRPVAGDFALKHAARGFCQALRWQGVGGQGLWAEVVTFQARLTVGQPAVRRFRGAQPSDWKRLLLGVDVASFMPSTPFGLPSWEIV